MKDLWRRLDKFWFVSLPPERVALLRIAVGAFTLWYLSVRLDLFYSISELDSSMFAPIGAAWWLAAPLSNEALHGLLYATLALNVAYLVGWRFRWTGPLFALSLLFLLSYRYSWSMIYHDANALVLQVLVIGFVASADAYSFDVWLRQRKQGHPAPPIAHERYGWPVRLICAVTVLTYLLAGIAKIRGASGWAWVSGEALRSQVAVDALRKEMLGGTVSPLFTWMYSQTELFLLMGVGSMFLELGAPLALVNRRIGMAWAVLTWTMHWGIFFMMGILFRFQMSGLLFLPFFEIEKLVPWLKENISGKYRGAIDAFRR